MTVRGVQRDRGDRDSPAVDRASRARGCLLGQVAGDSLGGQVEFQDADEIRGGYPGGVRELRDGGHWRTLAGQPTDDSELALALARSLADRGAFDDDAVALAYGRWYASGPFDCGQTVAQALSVAARVADHPAANARAVASQTSQANGALMRVSPLGVFGHAMEPKRLAELARRDATLTHPHPVCQDASALFAVTVAHAIRTGGSPADVYAFARQWAIAADLSPDVRARVEAAERHNVDDFSTRMGWVLIAFQNAFFQLLHAATLEEGVVDTVARGGDTDTNAAVAGALLGAVYRDRAIPAQWRDAVLACRPEAGRPGVRRPRPPEYWPVDIMELADALASAGSDAR
jgi:ADP-ribosylglycohydrolase